VRTKSSPPAISRQTQSVAIALTPTGIPEIPVLRCDEHAFPLSHRLSVARLSVAHGASRSPLSPSEITGCVYHSANPFGAPVCAMSDSTSPNSAFPSNSAFPLHSHATASTGHPAPTQGPPRPGYSSPPSRETSGGAAPRAQSSFTHCYNNFVGGQAPIRPQGATLASPGLAAMPSPPWLSRPIGKWSVMGLGGLAVTLMAGQWLPQTSPQSHESRCQCLGQHPDRDRRGTSHLVKYRIF
jgi:hypothetical protein